MIRHHKHLSEKDFNLAKSLLDADIPMKKIAVAMDRSYATVMRLKKFDNWKEYVAAKATYAKQKREEKGSNGIVEVNKGKVVAEFVKIREALSNLETWLTA